MEDNFAVFILTHGRPDNVKTYKTILKHGYTGKVYIIIDNEDKTADRYYQNFGDKVVMFDKLAISKTFDEADNFDNRKTIIYARNACFEIAEKVGVKYFIQLDDDYNSFMYRTVNGSKKIANLDRIFEIMTNYLKNTNITTIALSQGGDHIGGYKDDIKLKRKAMNSFVCSTDKKFKFVGRINEDVNTYVYLGGLGHIFFTIMNIMLCQEQTQKSKGGMSDIYLLSGTYVKSFYTILFNPSCVKIKLMGSTGTRLHHSIDWNSAVPCIIEEKYKKNAESN
jgi:hypothetical protein